MVRPFLRRLNDDCGSVAENFRGRTLTTNLRTLVPQSNDRIRPQFAGMLQQQVVSLLACLLAHLRIGSDLPADDLLKSTEEALAYGWGSYDDAADETFVFCDPISVKRKCRRRLHCSLHPCS